jgi:hypothetical protein
MVKISMATCSELDSMEGESLTRIGLSGLPSKGGAAIRGAGAMKEAGRARLTRRIAVRDFFDVWRMLQERVGGQ